METLKQNFILVPSHVREAYLYYFLCNPPESTLHLRRAPPEPTKPSRKQKGHQSKPSKKGKPQKKSSTNDDEAPEQPPPTIIFCTRPRTAAYLTHLLQSLRIRATALHSRLTQRERLSSLSLFRASVVPVLVSTDVGARGLDIEDVAIVINWDIPSEPEEYTHRVGRTARAGRGGVAVSFVTERDEERILKVEERIGESDASFLALPSGECTTCSSSCGVDVDGMLFFLHQTSHNVHFSNTLHPDALPSPACRCTRMLTLIGVALRVPGLINRC